MMEVKSPVQKQDYISAQKRSKLNKDVNMRKRAIYIILGAAFMLSILGCNLLTSNFIDATLVRGSGQVVNETRSISGVSSVALTMPGTLYISLGSDEELRIEAEDNIIGYIQTNVRGGKLQIEKEPGVNLQINGPLNYYLTVTNLESIENTSSGDVETEDILSDSLLIKLSSSGDLSMRSLDGGSLRVELTSSGDVEILGGEVQEQNIRLSSSGKYQARDLASERAEVNLTSSGSATVQASERISGRLSSSGNLYYVGNPSLDVSTSSSGKVERID